MILGQGTVVKTNEGLQWLERAADQDDYSAIRLLVDLYSHGYYGVPVRTAEAERWRQAALRADPGVLRLTFTGLDDETFASANLDAIGELTERIRETIEGSALGELAGPPYRTYKEYERIREAMEKYAPGEFAETIKDYSITITGPNPDAVWNKVESILKQFPITRQGCRVTKRYGPNIEGVREEIFNWTGS